MQVKKQRKKQINRKSTDDTGKSKRGTAGAEKVSRILYGQTGRF